jgi:Protein of unknown function (DUF2846)
METACYQTKLIHALITPMKPAFFTVFLLFSAQAFGQLLQPDPERATLVFFREFPSRFGNECWSCNYQIKVNGKQICNLSENRFVVYTVQPGNTLLESQPARRLFGRRTKGKVVLQTESNKIYYIRCNQNTDRVGPTSRGALGMKLDDVARAIPTLAEMKLDACAAKHLSQASE